MLGEEKLLQAGIRPFRLNKYKGFETCCDMITDRFNFLIALHVICILVCAFRELNNAPINAIGHVSKFAEVLFSFIYIFLMISCYQMGFAISGFFITDW